MHLLFVILLFIIIIFIIYVICSFNNMIITNYNSHEIWKSYPGKYEGFTLNSSSNIVPNSSPSKESYNKVDPFGLIDGSMKCRGSGYSNLNGNICLNDNQTMLLTTRGGNSKTGTTYEKK